jgi:hypothetical protein
LGRLPVNSQFYPIPQVILPYQSPALTEATLNTEENEEQEQEDDEDINNNYYLNQPHVR